MAVNCPFRSTGASTWLPNKYETLRRAERLQIPIPKTVYVQSADGVESAVLSCKALGYPLVVKPSRSRIQAQNGWVSSRVQYASDETKLRTMLKSDELSRAFPILVQKRIHGDAVGIFLCIDKAGETCSLSSHTNESEKNRHPEE